MEQPLDFMQKRRRRRSGDPALATRYQLDQVLRDFDLSCCLIVDDSADVVATAPEYPTPMMRRMAGLLPTFASSGRPRKSHLQIICGTHDPDLGADEVTACVFRAGGRRHYIGAVGPEAVMNELAIFRAIIGVRRILK